MAILFVGIDLAKTVFALHGVDEHGKAVLVAPKVPRDKLVGIGECQGSCRSNHAAFWNEPKVGSGNGAGWSRSGLSLTTAT